MSDDILDSDGEETPGERKARHALQGRAQWATLEAFEQLTREFQDVRKDVKQILGYLKGDFDAAGTPTDGALRRLNVMWAERNFLKTLAIAAIMILTGQLALAAYNSYTTHTQGQPVVVKSVSPLAP